MAKSHRKRLRERISEPFTLQRAWQSVYRGANLRSAGPDGKTVAEFRDNWYREKEQLRKELRTGTYRFGRYRGYPAPKRGGDIRPISIANVRDRVVQRAILDRIWPSIRRQVYTKASFGGVRRYRSSGTTRLEPEEHGKRSVETAARRIHEIQQKGFTWVFESDIKDFFPNIDRMSLLKRLQSHLIDDSLDGIVSDALQTDIVNREKLGKASQKWIIEYGVPQGGVLSPTLANFYLYDFDTSILENFHLVRYVDDFIILTDSREAAGAACVTCKTALSKLGLSMHPLKTQIRRPQEPFEFLGLTFTRNWIRPSDSKMQSLQQKIKEITDWREKHPLVEVIQQLNLLIKGWTASYKFCNLTKGDLRELDRFVGYRVRGWLERRQIIGSRRQLNNSAFQSLGIEKFESQHIDPIVPDFRHRNPRPLAGR